MDNQDKNEQDRRRKILEQNVGGHPLNVDRYLEKMSGLNPRDFDTAIMGLFQGGGPGAQPPQMTQKKIPGLNLPGGPSYAEGVGGEEAPVDKAALKNADEQALGQFQQRIAAEQQQRQQQQKAEQEKANRPHWADEWEQMYGKQFGRYEEVAGEKNVADANDEGDMFSAKSTGWNKYITRMTEQERQQEMKFLSPRVEAFEAMRQQLTEQYERMDPVARSHYNDMQKRSMAIEKAFGEKHINPLEYLRGMDELNGRAKQIKWKYHFRAPGAQPGEIVEQQGIRMMRNDKGGLDPIAYTPDFIKQNTIKLANGRLAVPLQPGKGYEIMDPEDVTDPTVVKTDGKDFNKLFSEHWDTSMEEYVKLHKEKPEGEDLVEFEKRVRAGVLSMMDTERGAVEYLHARSKERSDARKEGRPIQQQDPLESQMDQQYQDKQQKYDQAVGQHRQAQQTDLQNKQLAQDQQITLNLVVQHANKFGIPQEKVAAAIQSGYNPQMIIKNLGFLTQLMHEFPHAKSAADIPPAQRALFQQAEAMLKKIKGP